MIAELAPITSCSALTLQTTLRWPGIRGLDFPRRAVGTTGGEELPLLEQRLDGRPDHAYQKEHDGRKCAPNTASQ